MHIIFIYAKCDGTYPTSSVATLLKGVSIVTTETSVVLPD